MVVMQLRGQKRDSKMEQTYEKRLCRMSGKIKAKYELYLLNFNFHVLLTLLSQVHAMHLASGFHVSKLQPMIFCVCVRARQHQDFL